jgi:hypothetical protein
VRNGSSGGKKRRGMSAILHNDRYGHAIGGARKYHNYALCNLALDGFYGGFFVSSVGTALYFLSIFGFK